MWYNNCYTLRDCFESSVFLGEFSMKMSMSGQMRLEQRMKLAPRMIQSMEILQLPLIGTSGKNRAGAEFKSCSRTGRAGGRNRRIEHLMRMRASKSRRRSWSRKITTRSTIFERLDNMDDRYKEYYHRAESMRPRYDDGEPDKKLEAMQNTAAGPQSLNEYLAEQWRIVDALSRGQDGRQYDNRLYRRKRLSCRSA